MTTIGSLRIGKSKHDDYHTLMQYKQALGVASAMDIDRFFVIASAEGDTITDIWGRQYVDCTSQGWVASIGHSHPRVIAAVKELMEDGLIHVRPSYYTLPRLELAYRLTQIAPEGLSKVNFCLHGSVAVEGALKLVLIKNHQSPIAILDTGYSGRSIATMSLSWDAGEKPEFARLANRVVTVPSAYCYRCKFGKCEGQCNFECVEMTEAILRREKPSALIYEPVQGNGGQITFPYAYHRLLQGVCRSTGVTFIADEMQTAFGKLRGVFASDLYGVTPDILAFGKAIGGGFPLAGTLYGDDFDFRPGDQTFTAAGFPLSMAAALEVLSILEDERICEQADTKGEFFKALLLGLQERYAIIGDVRAEGLLIGVELVKDRQTKEPACDEVQQLIDFGIEHGVLFGCDKHGGLGNTLKIKPPAVITLDHVSDVVDVLERGLKTIN
ncbi:aspartate aminotransferase family protein [Chloroflexota bacterium]